MRMIDANALKRKAQKVATESWKMKVRARVETILNEFIDWIDKAPTIEVVPVGAYKQVKRERDIAVGQLEKLGYELGEKVTPIVRCKDCKYYAGEGMYCAWNIIAQFDYFYCYHGDRKELP